MRRQHQGQPCGLTPGACPVKIIIGLPRVSTSNGELLVNRARSTTLKDGLGKRIFYLAAKNGYSFI